MDTYFIDSNVFFYAKIFDREYGDPCAKVLRMIEKGEFNALTSTLLLVELVNALRKYGLSHEVRGVVDAIFSLDVHVYEVDPWDIRDAVDIFDEFRISPYDCVHAAIMKKAKTTKLVSVDRDFDKIAWMERLDPKNL